jgi:hypothetical protein
LAPSREAIKSIFSKFCLFHYSNGLDFRWALFGTYTTAFAMLQVYSYYFTILDNNGRIGAIDPTQKAVNTFSFIPDGS